MHKSRCLVAMACKSSTVAPNACVSSEWHLLHVTILAPNILRCSQFLQTNMYIPDLRIITILTIKIDICGHKATDGINEIRNL